MEEPWRVVRGIRSNLAFPESKLPWLMNAETVSKKDYCISGLPADISDEEMSEIMKEVCCLAMFGDPDVVGERIRFVSVHRRKEGNNRAWTWARVGLDAGIEHYFLKAKKSAYWYQCASVGV